MKPDEGRERSITRHTCDMPIAHHTAPGSQIPARIARSRLPVAGLDSSLDEYRTIFYHIAMSTPPINPPARGWTTWHITWGTYGTRLHGGPRPTVDRRRNQPGMAFIVVDPDREARSRNRMAGDPVRLTAEERRFIERSLPSICERGNWRLRRAAAGLDHVHVLCDLPQAVHGKAARRWLKTWLGQSLTARFGSPDAGRWWTEGGSTRVISDETYLRNATRYVHDQRATR